MNPTKHAVQQRPVTYDYSKEKNILDISETYTPIARLETDYREVGAYSLALSIAYTFSSANTSIFYRWRINGGSWKESQTEPKDKSDRTNYSYNYPVDWDGGEMLVEVEVKKETASGVFDVLFHNIVWERKG